MRPPPSSPARANRQTMLRTTSAPQLRRDRGASLTAVEDVVPQQQRTSASPDNVRDTPPMPQAKLPPPPPPPAKADATTCKRRAPTSPNGGEARRQLAAVLDALMGTAGQRKDRDLRLESGARVADHVAEHPNGAYTVRLFGDGFIIRTEEPQPARKRQRRGAVHTVHDAAATPLQAYADHAAFLADVRDARVPFEFRGPSDAPPVLVRLEVEDYLPAAYRDVHAYLEKGPEAPATSTETLGAEGRARRLKRFDSPALTTRFDSPALTTRTL